MTSRPSPLVTALLLLALAICMCILPFVVTKKTERKVVLSPEQQLEWYTNTEAWYTNIGHLNMTTTSTTIGYDPIMFDEAGYFLGYFTNTTSAEAALDAYKRTNTSSRQPIVIIGPP